MVKTTAADTALDNPATNYFTVITGVATGTRLDRVIIKLIGVIGTASSANVVRLWWNDGTNKRLLKEINFATATPTATAGGPEVQVHFPEGLTLPSVNDSLGATVHTRIGAQDDYLVHAFGADL
jgi:hypothetical protein